MIYLVFEIILYILAAGLLGFLVGWMLSSINSGRKADTIERRNRQKTLTLEKEHREEIDDFANNNRRFRAEVSRLNTNNKALRNNINRNNHALEIARSEISLLSQKLKTHEDLNDFNVDEEPAQHLSYPGNEFEKTMAIPDSQNFDLTVIEVNAEDSDASAYPTSKSSSTEHSTTSEQRDTINHT